MAHEINYLLHDRIGPWVQKYGHSTQCDNTQNFLTLSLTTQNKIIIIDFNLLTVFQFCCVAGGGGVQYRLHYMTITVLRV